MKYGIYGINRVTKDFLYLFGTLEVACFFEDAEMENPFGQMPVYTMEKLKEYKSFCDRILICDFQKDEKRRKLETFGLTYGEDFICEKDLFCLLDTKTMLTERMDVLVWGTGKRAEYFWKWNKDYPVVHFIDTYKKGETFHGREVKSPDDITDWKKTFIILAVAKEKEIAAYLEEKGLRRGG